MLAAPLQDWAGLGRDAVGKLLQCGGTSLRGAAEEVGQGLDALASRKSGGQVRKLAQQDVKLGRLPELGCRARMGHVRNEHDTHITLPHSFVQKVTTFDHGRDQ